MNPVHPVYLVKKNNSGNFGDSKAVGIGVRELKVDYGHDYQINLDRNDSILVIFLYGDTKKGQTRDITLAH